MKITCTNLGTTELVIEAINYVGQIYRFDEFSISITDNDRAFKFEIPSSEWLQRFSELLKGNPPQEISETLRGSGWLFNGRRTRDQVSIRVYDVGHRQDVEIKLTVEQAHVLHKTVMDSLLLPFTAQGGRLESLLDISDFRLA